MIEDRISITDVLGLERLLDASSLAAELTSSDALREEFDAGVIRRKAFCEALDVGESTLSTWLQTGRIPRVAALAYTLWIVVKKLKGELSGAAEPYVIRSHDGYAVVEPPVAGHADGLGRVIAQGIETLELAREIAAGRSEEFRGILDRALRALAAYAEQYDESDNWVADAAGDLRRARDFKVGSFSRG